MFKLAILSASVKEWKELYQTLYHCMLLTEIVSCQPREIQLFCDISNPEVAAVLKDIVKELGRVIDFDESKMRGRLVPKIGINPDLDISKYCFGFIILCT